MAMVAIIKLVFYIFVNISYKNLADFSAGFSLF